MLYIVGFITVSIYLGYNYIAQNLFTIWPQVSVRHKTNFCETSKAGMKQQPEF